jgi:putative ATPase
MKDLHYGQGYEYAHDLPEGRSDQAHLPPALQGRIYYEPTGRGFEAQVRERLAWREERQQQTEQGGKQAKRGKKQARSAPVEDPQTLAGEESQAPDE